jgi:hypothetical protein
MLYFWLFSVTSSDDSFEETLNVLRYANRAKNIKNRPLMNVIEEGRTKDELERLMKRDMVEEEVEVEDEEELSGGDGGGGGGRHCETWYPSNTQLVSEIQMEERVEERAAAMATEMATKMATEMAMEMAMEMVDKESEQRSLELETMVATLRIELREARDDLVRDEKIFEKTILDMEELRLENEQLKQQMQQLRARSSSRSSSSSSSSSFEKLESTPVVACFGTSYHQEEAELAIAVDGAGGREEKEEEEEEMSRLSVMSMVEEEGEEVEELSNGGFKVQVVEFPPQFVVGTGTYSVVGGEEEEEDELGGSNPHSSSSFFVRREESMQQGGRVSVDDLSMCNVSGLNVNVPSTPVARGRSATPLGRMRASLRAGIPEEEEEEHDGTTEPEMSDDEEVSLKLVLVVSCCFWLFWCLSLTPLVFCSFFLFFFIISSGSGRSCFSSHGGGSQSVRPKGRG